MHAKAVQIAWHKSQSISAIDFCPCPDANCSKLATAGQDNAVRLWSISHTSNSNSNSDSVTFLSTLHGHHAGVNIVRWSPTSSSSLSSTPARLASADNLGSILLWSPSPTPTLHLHATLAGDADEDPQDYKEHWRSTHVLQGHKNEVNDLAWSPCGKYLASVGTDQTLRIWQVPSSTSGGNAQVIGSAHDHSDVIQGVAWDPRGQLVATQAVDRSVYVYAITLQAVPGAAGRKVAVLKKVAEFKNGAASKLYSDPTTTPTSFFRRLAFSPDGSLLVTPAGLLALVAHTSPPSPSPGTTAPSTSTQHQHAVHVYSRAHLPLAQPSLSLPGYSSPAWCIRFCPSFFFHHPTSTPTQKSLALPYRMLFAVGSDDALVLYDSSSLHCPLAMLKNLHVYRYQDVAWSPDGKFVVASSHDGYCSLVALAEGEGEDKGWLRRVNVGDAEHPAGLGAAVAVGASATSSAAPPLVVTAAALVGQAQQPQINVLQVKKKRIQPTLISSFAPPISSASDATTTAASSGTVSGHGSSTSAQSSS